MMKDNILIVTSKWPGKTESSDGGNSTVRELITVLHTDYNIDLLYNGKYAGSSEMPGVNRVILFDHDFDHYETYSKNDGSKFYVRIENSANSAKMIERIADEYERIIIIHNMFLLGIKPDNMKLLKKVIVYPMFTGIDYRMAGEVVPDEYVHMESRLLNKVKAIVVPSVIEKNILINNYNVSDNIIDIVYRCVDTFKYNEHRLENNHFIKMVYIASVRKQKAHMDALQLVDKLQKCGQDVHLYCIGAIQDISIYENCIDEAKRLKIEDKIHFTGNMDRSDIDTFLENIDINISMSKWETFGRGLLEAFAAGIPSFFLTRNQSISTIDSGGVYPVKCDDIDDMSQGIIGLIKDEERYIAESKKGIILREALSIEKLKKHMDLILK